MRHLEHVKQLNEFFFWKHLQEVGEMFYCLFQGESTLQGESRKKGAKQCVDSP
jgi:hypothetical protein